MSKTFIVAGDFTITGNIYVEAETAQEAVDKVRNGESEDFGDIGEFNCKYIDEVWIDDKEGTECDDWE